MLLGRIDEKATVERVVRNAREGIGGSLVVRGEAGVGKSALLQHAADQSADLLLRTSGVESEMSLDFAALHTLLTPVLGGLDSLPIRQRNALSAAFGLEAGAAGDKFLVGLAALTLLTEAAEQQPILCIVDDCQWLDQESIEVLAFVARRLGADQLAILFGLRVPTDPGPPLDGLDHLDIEGLGADDARELLQLSVNGTLNQLVAGDLIEQTRGNPLALVELGRELSPGQLSGASSLPANLPLGERLEASFLRQVRRLPPDAQTVLLVAAAEAGGDPETVLAACEGLGVDRDAVSVVEASGLLQMAPTVAFRHPLVRSATYTGASGLQRRRAHQALAQATDAVRDPDRRAWHRAAATIGLDEAVAAELAEGAGRARLRGGYAAETALLLRSAELTPDADGRCDRILLACAASLSAGDATRAENILGLAHPLLRTPTQQATADRMEGLMSISLGRTAAAAGILLRAARSLEPIDPELARHTMLDALDAFFTSASLTTGTTRAEITDAALEMVESAPHRGEAAPSNQLLLEAMALAVGRGFAEAAPMLRQVTASTASPRTSLTELTVCPNLRLDVANELNDEGAYAAALRRLEEGARQQGALLTLTVVLIARASGATRAGHFSQAQEHYAEVFDVAQAISPYAEVYRLLAVELMAWRGQEDEARAAVETLTLVADMLGARTLLYNANFGLIELELGLGRYDAALAAAGLIADDDIPGWASRALPNLVEAAMRCGELDLAARTVATLAERAEASPTPWAIGLLHRCQALAAPDDDRTDARFRSAIEQLDRTSWGTEQARTHLLHGEWLRRQKREAEARPALRTAYERFARMGATAFAERARVELLATGERARADRSAALDDLTPQEAQIARLASERNTSREIAAQLFISANTVDYHLRKIFRKLDVSSRRELPAVLSALEQADPH